MTECYRLFRLYRLDADVINKIDRTDKIDETFQKKINNEGNKNSKKRMSR
jgi:hypothetical protein